MPEKKANALTMRYNHRLVTCRLASTSLCPRYPPFNFSRKLAAGPDRGKNHSHRDASAHMRTYVTRRNDHHQILVFLQALS